MLRALIAVALQMLSASLFADSRWLEIKVGSDPALTPRQPLVTVAYAFKADTVPDNATTASKIRDGSITAAKLAGGALDRRRGKTTLTAARP
jgi:hypothetical protein